GGLPAAASRFHHALDAVVLLVLERLVKSRRVVEAAAVRDDEGRVDLAGADEVEQRPPVAVDVRHRPGPEPPDSNSAIQQVAAKAMRTTASREGEGPRSLTG